MGMNIVLVVLDSSGESAVSKDTVNVPHLCVCVRAPARGGEGRCRCSDCVGVIGSKRVQIAQLTQTTLDVCHVDLNVILKATGNTGKKRGHGECFYVDYKKIRN